MGMTSHSAAAWARALVIGFVFAFACGAGVDDRSWEAEKLTGEASRRLLAACTPKTYPTSGTLLPVTTSGRIVDVVWANGTNPAVYALTMDKDNFRSGALWRTDDATRAERWHDLTATLEQALPSGSAGGPDTASVASVYLWAPDNRRVFLQGRGQWHWTSTDGGATFRAAPSPGGTEGEWQSMELHPRRADWVLARTRRQVCAQDRRSTQCAWDLFLSQDFGASWRNLTESSKGHVASVRDFAWGAALAEFANEPTPDEAIFATVFPGGAQGKGLYPGWDRDMQYVVSLDFFAGKPAKTVPCGNLFEVIGGKVFLAVPSDCPLGPDGAPRQTPKTAIPGRSVTLYASDRDGDEFSEVCLPTELEDDGYNLVHTHENTGTFVLADHAEPGSRSASSDSPSSDLYAPPRTRSCAVAGPHSLSLRGVYRRDSVADFARVEGLPGVYLANAVDEAAAGGRKPAEEALRTMRTDQGGSRWAPLAPPDRFVHSRCNACAERGAGAACALHLHGASSWAAPSFASMPSVYAPATAPGLVLGVGTVGAYLDVGGGAATCTYLSMDGGLSWKDVAEGAQIYETGSRGGVVVLAKQATDGPASEVLFSLDAGDCWHRVALPESILVDNVRTDPEGAGAVFAVIGSACARRDDQPGCTFSGGYNPPGKLYVLDLRELARGDVGECGPDDYADWAAPSGADGCLLGAKRTLQRRRPGLTCLDKPGFRPREPRAEPCACQLQDTECDYGFERVNGTCLAMQGVPADACPGLQKSGYVLSATKLRQVHADVCEGIERLIPDAESQGAGGGGGRGGGGFWKGLFYAALVPGIVLVVAGVVWANCLPETLKLELAGAAEPLLAGLASAGWALLDAVIAVYDAMRLRVGGWRRRQEIGDAYFEPLADRLEVDPEDHRSPPLFR